MMLRLLRVIAIYLVCLFPSIIGNQNIDSITNYSPLPSSEYNALYDLYIQTQGDYWALSQPYSLYGYPWNFTSPEFGNPCNVSRSWQGLTCYDECQNISYASDNTILTTNSCYVYELSLNSLNLTGSIPKSIGEFSQLINLEMVFNELTGAIPSTISNLTQLNLLALYNNQLSGSLTSSVCQFSSLVQLILSDNLFTHTIPSCLHNLTQIKYLALDNNAFTGTIPSTIHQLQALKILWLGGNLLTGTIPNNFIDLINLQSLSLQANLLNGTIPITFGSTNQKSSQLIEILLYNNELTGTFPIELCNLSNITTIALNYNWISGSLPEEFGNLINLKMFFLFLNLLTGPLPSTIGQLTSMKGFFVNTNALSGSLPPSINSMTSLVQLALYENALSGSLSQDFGSNFYSLTILSLFTNYLTGYLPVSFGSMWSLQNLYLANNLFSGTIPSSWGNSDNYITTVDLESNVLTGNIPNTFAILPNLNFLYLSYNQLTGSFPQEIFSSTHNNLIQLVISHNILTGSFFPINDSSWTLQNNYYLKILDGSYNCFDGQFTIAQFVTISSTNSYNYRLYDYFSISHNNWMGTIPYSLFALPYIKYLSINSNYLTSTLPSIYPDNTTSFAIEYLDLSSNLLTGTFPTILSNLNVIQYLSLANNFFMGILPFTFNSPHFEVFYAQNNSFTGSISSELVSHGKLSIFMASFNCLTGVLPESFCYNLNLTQLLLDGLHSSSSCVHPIFSFLDSSGYLITNGVHGTIPSCLFNIPSLKIMHLSGNNFHGTLPSQLTIDQSNLISLILANNMLSGSIPTYLINNENIIFYLDLSFNKFNQFHLNNLNHNNNSNNNPSDSKYYHNISTYLGIYPTLYLQVNHLSGNLPPIIYNKTIEAVNVLEGNMFSCDSNHHNLPSQDPNYHSYDCGSDYTNNSLYALLSLVLCILLGYLCLYHWTTIRDIFTFLITIGNQNILQLHQLASDETMKLRLIHLETFTQTYQIIVYLLISITIWLLIAIIPAYISFSYSHGTYLHQYIWVISSSYLSGKTPAIVLLFLYLVLIFILMYHLIPHLHSVFVVSTERFRRNILVLSSKISSNKKTFAFLMLFLIFQTCLVLLVNIGYIYSINHGYSNTIMTFISISISLFKIFWTNIMLLGYGRVYIQTYLQIKLDTSLILLLSIFNNVLAPYLAEAFISPNCFLYDISQPPKVHNIYYDIQCFPSYTCTLEFSSSNVPLSSCTFDISCNNLQSLISTTSSIDPDHYSILSSITYSQYVPPFHYNYTCSSSLLASFAYVFIYRYLFSGILEPLIFGLIYRTFILNPQNQSHQDNRNSISFLSSKLISILPFLMKEDAQIMSNILSPSRYMINPGEKSIVRLITDVTMFLSFGILFPPLGFLIVISIIIDISLEQYLLQKLFNKKTKSTKDIEVLQSLDRYYTIWTSLIWIGLFWASLVAVLFWSFNLYDILANDNTVGNIQAIWIIFVMGLSPYWSLLLVVVCLSIYNYILKGHLSISSNNESVDCIQTKEIELSSQISQIHEINDIEKQPQKEIMKEVINDQVIVANPILQTS